MKIIMALMVLHCQNYFDNKGCADQKMACVDEFATLRIGSFLDNGSDKILIGKIERVYAEAFYHCTKVPLSVICGEDNDYQNLE